jgi:hypothetical protein
MFEVVDGSGRRPLKMVLFADDRHAGPPFDTGFVGVSTLEMMSLIELFGLSRAVRLVRTGDPGGCSPIPVGP